MRRLKLWEVICISVAGALLMFGCLAAGYGVFNFLWWLVHR
jgi:hypothetical protein